MPNLSLAPRDRPPGLRRALFLDRDGVLNVDVGYAHRPDQILWIDGAAEAIRSARRRDYLIFVVTNQAGVAHGYYEEHAVHALHDWMHTSLAEVGAIIDAFFYCPHHPQGVREEYRQVCGCRKPAPGLLKRAEPWGIDWSNSMLIGDKETDLEAGRAAGVAAHLFTGGDLSKFTAQLFPSHGQPAHLR